MNTFFNFILIFIIKYSIACFTKVKSTNVQK